MTYKFIGQFVFKNDNILKEETKTLDLPKREWHNYSIWEFNGKRYRPVTQKAVDDLESLVQEIQNNGYTAAKKNGKIKPSSIKYAILTTGIEDFKFIK